MLIKKKQLIAWGGIGGLGLGVAFGIAYFARTERHEATRLPSFNDAEVARVIERFCSTIEKAQTYRAKITSTITPPESVRKKYIVTNVFELSVLKPSHVRLWVNEGVTGPVLLCDGSRVFFAFLPRRFPENISKAPATITNVTSPEVLGARASQFVHNRGILDGLITGNPRQAVARCLPGATYVAHEYIHEKYCIHVRSETEQGNYDAWFETTAQGLLCRLSFHWDDSTNGFSRDDVFDEWIIDEIMSPDLFQWSGGAHKGNAQQTPKG